MRRVLSVAVRAVLALASVGVVALWARSHRVRDAVVVRRGVPPAQRWDQTQFVSHGGVVAWVRRRESDARAAAPDEWRARPYPREREYPEGGAAEWVAKPATPTDPADHLLANRLGFRWAPRPRPNMFGAPVDRSSVAVPHWLPALLLAAWPAGSAAARLLAKRRARRRRARGLCPACGYDWRETPGRCPECGRGRG